MLVITGCIEDHKNNKSQKSIINFKKNVMNKKIDKNLPTIGILIFEGVIINEVVAPLDVFSSKNFEGKTLFNVITIGTESKI